MTDAPDFNPSADAEALYNAMKGIGKCPPAMNFCESASQLKLIRFILCFSSGSDKEAILDLVTSRSNAQRQEVIAAYKNCFGKVC